MSSRQRAARKTTSPEWPQALPWSRRRPCCGSGSAVRWQTDRERSPATSVGTRLDQDSEAFRRALPLRTASPSPVDPIDSRWLSPQDEHPAVTETPPLFGALLRLIPIAYGRCPPSKVRRLPNGPLTGARRKRNGFVFSTNRPVGMPIVGEDGTLHPEPVRRTGFAFADASD